MNTISNHLCPLCGVTTDVIKNKKIRSAFTIIYCPSCDFTFSYPMEQADKNWYENSPIYEGHLAADEVRTDKNHLSKTCMDWRVKKLLPILSRRYKEVSKIKLLDIGCGDGGLLEALKNSGFDDIYGIDINSAAIRKARDLRGLKNVAEGDFRELRGLNYGANSFDCVTIFEVLEHSSDPAKLLSDIVWLLKKEGCIFLTVPNLNRRPRFFDEELDFPPHHLTLWSEKAITKALGAAGFTDIKVEIKPLDKSEFIFHTLRKIKKTMPIFKERTIRKTGGNPSNGKSRAVKEISRLRLLAWRMIFIAAEVAAFFVRLIFKNGGFMLFASARKN